VRHGGGSSGRAAAGALRLANSVGAALGHRRVLGATSAKPLFLVTVVLLALAVVAVLWPAWVGWPFAALCGWFALNLGIRGWRLQRRHRREVREAKPG
jgi:cardiolipin synthase